MLLPVWVEHVNAMGVFCVRLSSGRILSLEELGDGAVSVPRPGQRHDEWRLRFLHVRAGQVESHRSAVAVLHRRLGRPAETPAGFLRRQTGLAFTRSVAVLDCFVQRRLKTTSTSIGGPGLGLAKMVLVTSLLVY